MNPLAHLGLQQAGPLRQAPGSASTPDGPGQTRVQEDGYRGRAFEERPDLLHPGTPEEYREVLEPLLARLPLGLVQGFAEEGYVLHVLGDHPLTLDPEPPDPDAPPREEVWGAAGTLADVAERTGASLWDLAGCNPHLEADPEAPVAEGEVLRLPEVRYFGETPVRPEAWEFLTQPRRSFVAGLVTHGRLPGIRGDENRILLWDLVFRDPLRDWYVLHELGHATDFTFAFRQPDAWRAWRVRLVEAHARDEGPFTRYAGESPTEYFAEGFAAWATPEPGEATVEGDLARQRLAMSHEELRARAPELFELIEEAAWRSAPNPLE